MLFTTPSFPTASIASSNFTAGIRTLNHALRSLKSEVDINPPYDLHQASTADSASDNTFTSIEMFPFFISLRSEFSKSADSSVSAESARNAIGAALSAFTAETVFDIFKEETPLAPNPSFLIPDCSGPPSLFFTQEQKTAERIIPATRQILTLFILLTPF